MRRRLLKRWLLKEVTPKKNEDKIIRDPEYNLEYLFYINKRAVSTRY